MRHLLIALAAALVLSACGTVPYTPVEYPLRDGLIPPVNVKGQVETANAQSSTAPVIVYSYGGTKLSSDLRSITDVMVKQTQTELAKAARPETGASKSIELKVESLKSTYKFFYWNSELKFVAKLGNGETVMKTVPHGSGVLLQDLNGCIAESVMVLLNDPKVRAYLAE
ncbi:hypothetical protein GCM10027084_26710 [Pseudoxanthomonas sangjuensis]|uniref:hypothetical protein n=1 Tax=Pseudoxanthomonas sangjuensis TaxID=1503750 RepID=UPI00139073A9|nr:hypothetical protein [Pseudoxanthomonas sangjuensis]KAF1714495.1 hypothetical protein CSC71_03745 [Pseudoxanthomonas sangjuensis]